MNVTIIRRAFWAVAALAAGYAAFALWYGRLSEFLLSAGLFIICIPIDMFLAREEREHLARVQAGTPFGPVRKWGRSEPPYARPLESALTTNRPYTVIAARQPWWRRLYRRLIPWSAAVLLLIPGLVALVDAPPADATPREDYAYISTLDNFDVYYSSESAAITLGYSICDALDAGIGVERVVRIGINSGGYTRLDSEYIVGAAIGVYCPDHAGLLDGLVAA